MNVLPQTSLFLGIIPALILLYIGLKGYEGQYKDKTIFLTFVVGIILGFVAAFAQLFTLPGVIVYVILLACFQQLLKTIVLNIRRFHEKRETTIYGLSLGLGFGSSFTPFLMVAVSSLKTTDSTVLLLIAIGTLGLILFHGATGTYIGFGVYKGKLTKYILTAIIVQLPINGLLDMAIIYSDTTFFSILGVLVIGAIIYGAVAFWYVVKKIMPQILSQKQR